MKSSISVDRETYGKFVQTIGFGKYVRWKLDDLIEEKFKLVDRAQIIDKLMTIYMDSEEVKRD